MSNESENKRINLIQFKGNERGWMYDVEGIGAHPKNLFEKVERKFKSGGVKTMPLYLDEQQVNAITLLPDLIIELKRCYEKIDALQGKIDRAHETMEKYSNEEIDNVCDAYEQVCMAL